MKNKVFPRNESISTDLQPLPFPFAQDQDIVTTPHQVKHGQVLSLDHPRESILEVLPTAEKGKNGVRFQRFKNEGSGKKGEVKAAVVPFLIKHEINKLLNKEKG